MHQNMSLGPNGVNRVCSLRKIMMRFRAKNFCASSARFALSFVRQPNGPKCLQIVQNTPKYEFRVQWGVSGAFLREIPTRLRGTHFCTNLASFALSFVTQPNYPKCTQVVQNALKHEVRVQWGGLSYSLLKIPTRLHGTNFCTSSARFALSFVRQPNGSKYIQIVQNTPKHVFRVQWGWIRCIRCEKFRCDFVARTFAPVWSFLHRVL